MLMISWYGSKIAFSENRDDSRQGLMQFGTFPLLSRDKPFPPRIHLAGYIMCYALG